MHFWEGIACGPEKRQLERVVDQANIESNRACTVEFPWDPFGERGTVGVLRLRWHFTS